MLFNRSLYFMVSVSVLTLCVVEGIYGNDKMDNSSRSTATSLSTSAETSKQPVVNRRNRIGFFKPPPPPPATSDEGTTSETDSASGNTVSDTLTPPSDSPTLPSSTSGGPIDGRMRGNSGIGLRGLSSDSNLSDLASGK